MLIYPIPLSTNGAKASSEFGVYLPDCWAMNKI